LALIAPDVGGQGRRQARSSFCEQKEAKKLHDGASRQKLCDGAQRLGGLETLPSPSARRCKADGVFCALFFKKAPLACRYLHVDDSSDAAQLRSADKAVIAILFGAMPPANPSRDLARRRLPSHRAIWRRSTRMFARD
jgi:hypothetical protein